jgi:uncharacterized protein (DUF302 family)
LVRDGVSEEAFVERRRSREANLAPPALIFPALQVNPAAARRERTDLSTTARHACSGRRRFAMSYYFSRTIEAPFSDVVDRTREALAQEGFGVITEIDVTKTLKTKIGVDFRPYLILGACNPALAHEALKLEDKVGTMLPCNVVVQDAGGGRTEIAAIDPAASMQAIDNPRLREKAGEVAGKLKAALQRI